jgi:hypothetical protein
MFYPFSSALKKNSIATYVFDLSTFIWNLRLVKETKTKEFWLNQRSELLYDMATAAQENCEDDIQHRETPDPQWEHDENFIVGSIW